MIYRALATAAVDSDWAKLAAEVSYYCPGFHSVHWPSVFAAFARHAAIALVLEQRLRSAVQGSLAAGPVEAVAACAQAAVVECY